MTGPGGATAPPGDADAPPPRPLRPAALAAVAATALAMICGFLALGIWQLERRVWKHELIARVEARLSAPPVAPPGPREWTEVSASRDEYRRVRLAGDFDHARETHALAVTALGGGFWVLTPMRVGEGFTVLVNRGFVPPEAREPTSRPAPPNPATVTGLIRMSEPKGAFLRDNEPAADLWRSRDVDAIAETRGLRDVAPYFVDADATPSPGGWPVGGLTVTRFSDNHLVYALTWFALALMTAGGAGLVARRELRLRRAAR